MQQPLQTGMPSAVCWSHLGSSCPPRTDRDCAFWQLLAAKGSQGYERMGHPGTPQLGEQCSTSFPCQFSPQTFIKPQGPLAVC